MVGDLQPVSCQKCHIFRSHIQRKPRRYGFLAGVEHGEDHVLAGGPDEDERVRIAVGQERHKFGVPGQ